MQLPLPLSKNVDFYQMWRFFVFSMDAAVNTIKMNIFLFYKQENYFVVPIKTLNGPQKANFAIFLFS